MKRKINMNEQAGTSLKKVYETFIIFQLVVSMRGAGLAHNTVATYLRVLNTFLRWCQREGLSDVSIPNIKEKDTVKETYTDAFIWINSPNCNNKLSIFVLEKLALITVCRYNREEDRKRRNGYDRP